MAADELRTETLEGQVADAILETPHIVSVGGQQYEVAPPSLGTLILVSKAVSALPAVRMDGTDVISQTLDIAQDCRPIAEACAIMVLGAKRLATGETERNDWLRFWRTNRKGMQEKERLTERILTECTPRQLSELAVELLSRMQIADFFGLTTSLLEVNLLRKTREVASGTTASGQ